MSRLELRIPPPVVAAIVAILMWGLSKITPGMALDSTVKTCASVLFALAGIAINMMGFFSFRLAQTAVNPMKPETASKLVTTGIFSHTRNPMYFGLVLLHVAWGIYLVTPFAFVGPVVFVLFLNRFQIEPEERILSEKFGSDYLNYKEKVRRWV